MLVGSALLGAARGFLSSTTGRYVLVLVAFIAWTGYQRHDAAVNAVDALTAQIEAATAEEYQRRAGVAEELARAARARASEVEIRANQLELERDEIIQQIRTIPGGDCPIPDSVRQRLLSIGN